MVYSSLARSAAFAVSAPVEDLPAETSTTHVQPPSVRNLVVVGYFVDSLAVFVPDLMVGHLLPYHLVVVVVVVA